MQANNADRRIEKPPSAPLLRAQLVAEELGLILDPRVVMDRFAPVSEPIPLRIFAVNALLTAVRLGVASTTRASTKTLSFVLALYSNPPRIAIIRVKRISTALRLTVIDPEDGESIVAVFDPTIGIVMKERRVTRTKGDAVVAAQYIVVPPGVAAPEKAKVWLDVNGWRVYNSAGNYKENITANILLVHRALASRLSHPLLS